MSGSTGKSARVTMVCNVHAAGKCAMANDERQVKILTERAEIEQAIAGRTLCGLLEDNARQYR